MTKDMTQGSPLKLLLAFAVPLMLGSLFQQFYNLADTIIVGRFVGVEALAAVGSVGGLNYLVLGFVNGIACGFSIPISWTFGARDHHEMHFARDVADRILFMDGGVVVEEGPAKQLIDHPREQRTKQFLAHYAE